jgi:C1A family cysteine protease
MVEHKIFSLPHFILVLALFLLASGLYLAFRPGAEPSITGQLVLDSSGTASLLPMFSPFGDTEDYLIEKTFRENAIMPLSLPGIFGLSITGKADISSEDSLIRVTLVTEHGEFLVYEAYPNIAAKGSLIFSNICEETCAMGRASPSHLSIQVENAELTLEKVHYIGSAQNLNVRVRAQGISSFMKELKHRQDDYKISRINRNNLGWAASHTSKSSLWYEEKKSLFGQGNMPVSLPNTRGIEYYSGGVFSFGEYESSLVEPDRLPSSWDWRFSKGYNLITPPKDQGTCAASWAYSVVSAAELLYNIKAERRTGMLLSVDELVTCSGSGSCEGGFSFGAINYIRSKGISPETCFAETEEDKCRLGCLEEKQWVSGYSKLREHEFLIKQALVEKGPVVAGLKDFGHSMHLIGYETEEDGTVTWAFKNSWGTGWGEEGFIRIKANPEEKFFETYVIE